MSKLTPSQAAAFSPDGRLLAIEGGDETTRVWDVAGGALRSLGRRELARDGSIRFGALAYAVCNEVARLMLAAGGTRANRSRACRWRLGG